MKKLIALAALLPLLPDLALADTGYYMVTTYDVEGQASVDYKYWNAHYNGMTVAAPEIGIGYGVTSRWYTELYGSWVKVNGGGAVFSELAWQNDYLLTQGQYPFDLAIHTKLERPRDRSEGYALEIGPVLQTEIGRTQFNANVFFQRDYRTEDGGPTEMTYQLQVKHRWKSWFQPGLQAFGEVGKWNDWLPLNRQSHRAGPAIFGSRDIGGKELKYEAAYLIGRNDGRAAKSFTMRLQYLF
ncbi:MAG TPA: hypothetical protein VFT05_03055 [Burkholderiaceae bacterium]|nr:hypothetical protein [Burkholderiaceae bacterium]